MKYFILFLMVILFCVGLANAFSNSLSISEPNKTVKQNNNFSSPNSSTYKNKFNQPFNPKEHTGFSHQDRNFPNPTVNDERYNSDCQFGTCMPGGINK